MKGRKPIAQKRKPSSRIAARTKKKQHQKAHQQKQLLKWAGWGLALLAAVAVLIIYIPKITNATEISAAQAYEKYQQGAFFLDVRSQEEWDQVHIANSKLIPLDELQNRLSELPTDNDIVVVCLVGKRSQEGMTILRQAGYSRASCMTGGLNAWKIAGYPLEGISP